ncbi:MAG: hypothetical protein DMG16_15425 [Acidobacteria bacterium]|nr:MAG: hypothetical protein DMG16_15425 [Acidobacteriota bacterium]
MHNKRAKAIEVPLNSINAVGRSILRLLDNVVYLLVKAFSLPSATYESTRLIHIAAPARAMSPLGTGLSLPNR